ncbi:MAG: endonuclease III [Ezakiella sp.]|nr:endonuclease III [Ezakiella sp.]
MAKNILNKNEIAEVCEILMNYHIDARCELKHASPYELLIATILSAQCTDVRVNKITEELFSVANTPEKICELGIESLKNYIKSAGFFNTKAENIIETSQILIKKYDSKVPQTMDELVSLPGVGRKTANVVLANCFNVPTIAVDTHVFRVTNRIGIVKADNVLDTEKALMKKLPKDIWVKMHHVFIFHGRRVCSARNPKCNICPVIAYCLYLRRKNEV